MFSAAIVDMQMQQKEEMKDYFAREILILKENEVRHSMAARPTILDGLTDLEIMQRYRFDRRGIDHLEGLLRPYLQPRTARHHSLSVREKKLIALRFLATGGVQLNDGDIHHVAQSTVSKVVNEFVTALCSPAIIQQFVSFPTRVADPDNQVQQFHGIAGFPKTVGVIDRTHIKIVAPSEEEDEYVNRKGYHSINVQVVFDAFDMITDVVARWPGSTHDSRILHNSGLRQLFETGIIQVGYHLLGDSGYPCRRWLLTPYLNPQPGAQSAYNRVHKITRSKVEREIGQLKRRFGVLHGEIRMKPDKACRVITACAVLHNICKQRAIPLPDVDNDNQDDQPNNAIDQNAPQVGLRYRDYIANTYF